MAERELISFGKEMGHFPSETGKEIIGGVINHLDVEEGH